MHLWGAVLAELLFLLQVPPLLLSIVCGTTLGKKYLLLTLVEVIHNISFNSINQHHIWQCSMPPRKMLCQTATNTCFKNRVIRRLVSYYQASKRTKFFDYHIRFKTYSHLSRPLQCFVNLIWISSKHFPGNFTCPTFFASCTMLWQFYCLLCYLQTREIYKY